MKKLLIFIFSLILAFSLPVTVFAESSAYDIEPPAYATEIALLVNADTDTVVFSKNLYFYLSEYE